MFPSSTVPENYSFPNYKARLHHYYAMLFVLSKLKVKMLVS